MQTETNLGNHLSNVLSQKLASLPPKTRTTNKVKFAENYDGILDAINRGVSGKAIRVALAENGVTMSSVTFKKLLETERMWRDARRDTEDSQPLFSVAQMEKAHD